MEKFRCVTDEELHKEIELCKQREGTLDGNNITEAYTLGSMYDMQSIALKDGRGNEFRIKALDIRVCLNEFIFKTEKARKYTYLRVDWEKTKELWGKEGFI